MRTLQDLLPEIADLEDHEAIRWSNGFRTITSSYADLYGTIGAAVNYFEKNGIRKGDRLLIWAENRMEWIAVFWACISSGVIAVPVDLRFSEDLIRRIESESKARLTIDRSALDTIGCMAEEKATRGASRYDAVIATLVGFLALCVSGYTAYMQRQQVRLDITRRVERPAFAEATAWQAKRR